MRVQQFGMVRLGLECQAYLGLMAHRELLALPVQEVQIQEWGFLEQECQVPEFRVQVALIRELEEHFLVQKCLEQVELLNREPEYLECSHLVR